MKKIVLILIVLLTSFLLFGCTQTGNINDEKIEVMASFFPFYDIAKNVAGDKASVSVLVAPGTEPHSFNPSPQDILRVSRASIFIVSGTEFEEWEERIVENVNPSAKIVNASSGVNLLLAEFKHSHEDEEEHSLEEECLENDGIWIDEHEECENISESVCKELNGEFKECESACRNDPTAEFCTLQCVAVCSFEEDEHGLYDPHFWISPTNVIIVTDNITSALIEADPENKEYYLKNAEEYKKKIMALHNEFEKGLSACEKSEIITTHAAFAYLANDYGFEQIPILGLSPDSEPTPSQIVKLIEEASYHGIKHIFYEELVDPRVAQTIASEVGAEVLVLNNIEGSKDDKGYIELMTQNLNNLKIALECK